MKVASKCAMDQNTSLPILDIQSTKLFFPIFVQDTHKNKPSPNPQKPQQLSPTLQPKVVQFLILCPVSSSQNSSIKMSLIAFSCHLDPVFCFFNAKSIGGQKHELIKLLSDSNNDILFVQGTFLKSNNKLFIPNCIIIRNDYPTLGKNTQLLTP